MIKMTPENIYTEEYLQKKQTTNTEQSKWKITNEGDWKLFFNTEKKVQEDPNNIDLSKLKSNNVRFNTLSKKLKLGCKVMTPLGIGTLVQMENKEMTVRFSKEEK